jgi:hypothetical protein
MCVEFCIVCFNCFMLCLIYTSQLVLVPVPRLQLALSIGPCLGFYLKTEGPVPKMSLNKKQYDTCPKIK